MRERFALPEELPQHPRTWDMLRFALRNLGPWLIALVITVYLSYALPSSLGKSLAMVLAYALVVGTCFSAICVIAFSLLDGPHCHRALYILRHQAFRPLWLIGSFAAFGEALSDPSLVTALGQHLAHTAATSRCHAASPIVRSPTRCRSSAPSWYMPALLLLGISLFATFLSAGDTSTPCANRCCVRCCWCYAW